MALTTDTSVLTALANDYGFENVFARQVAGYCRPGEVVVGISTSGNSRNVILALSIYTSSGPLRRERRRPGSAFRARYAFFVRFRNNLPRSIPRRLAASL
jgi:hypothetical protein